MKISEITSAFDPKKGWIYFGDRGDQKDRPPTTFPPGVIDERPILPTRHDIEAGD